MIPSQQALHNWSLEKVKKVVSCSCVVVKVKFVSCSCVVVKVSQGTVIARGPFGTVYHGL
ncbi:hypothetical protein RchiOBHm_Chr5g0036381 [Rosa chinensis]|uniref:Uncharacterized protein n=1 Tax=Rosa chinensis TaxID=74649 RepID=A0A2P6QBG2_ROSCH|nr:hypothetical protein RchiOBHm_Chr5g0036381 [Rosa chinensis]